MTNVRTWPDEKVRAAQRAMEDARRARAAADRFYLSGVSDRKAQERREAEIAAQNLGEPYYLPANPTLEDDGHDMMSHARSIVFRWITDEDLESRRLAFVAAMREHEAAEGAYEAARAESRPTTETEIKEAAEAIGASYAANQEMKIGGTIYPAGHPIPDEVLDSMDFHKVARWETSGQIRRLTNA